MSFLDLIRRLERKCRRAVDAVLPARTVQVVDADVLPQMLPARRIVVAREGGEDWYAGLICPCGCGDKLQLALFREARPRWDLMIDARGRPSFYPSVWRRNRCGAHFWVRNGKIFWTN